MRSFFAKFLAALKALFTGDEIPPIREPTLRRVIRLLVEAEVERWLRSEPSRSLAVRVHLHPDDVAELGGDAARLRGEQDAILRSLLVRWPDLGEAAFELHLGRAASGVKRVQPGRPWLQVRTWGEGPGVAPGTVFRGSPQEPLS